MTVSGDGDDGGDGGGDDGGTLIKRYFRFQWLSSMILLYLSNSVTIIHPQNLRMKHHNSLITKFKTLLAKFKVASTKIKLRFLL